ncbi:MAG: hypothetical protein AB7I27_09145 [Bacteriovoracaceae bacterium]
MKKIILSTLLAASLPAGAEITPEEMITNVATFVTSAPALSALCAYRISFENRRYDTECQIVTAESMITTSIAMAKDLVEVKPDAYEYSITGEASASLVSVVEKLQAVALEQNQNLTFDQVVDAINAIH